MTNNSDFIIRICDFITTFANVFDERTKMKKIANSLKATLIMLWVACVMISCMGTADRAQQQADSLKMCELDSLVTATMNADADHVLGLIDSLETAGAASFHKICYYRALAYEKLDRKSKTKEWCEKALEGKELQNEDPILFYEMIDLLSTTLTYLEKNEEALTVAQRGLAVAQTDQTPDGRHWVAVLLHDVGYCEMSLGRVEEAEVSFSQAYIALKLIASTDKDFENLQTFARVSYNIVDSYTSTGQYDKAKGWIDSTEDAVDMLIASPECSTAMKENYLGGLAIQRAIVLVHTGHRREADAAYREALRLGYANTGLGILERATYLEHAGRWNDLAELMPRIDSLSNVWGDSVSLSHWNQYRKLVQQPVERNDFTLIN